MSESQIRNVVAQQAEEYRGRHPEFPRLAIRKVMRVGDRYHVVVEPIDLTMMRSVYYDHLYQLGRLAERKLRIKVLLAPSLLEVER